MRRDMDLVRNILLATEADEGDPRGWIKLELSADPSLLAYHVQLLDEAGLLVAQDLQHLGPGGYRFLPKRLTWEGHEYVDNIRDPEVWRKAKEGAAGVGGFSLEMLGALARGLIKTKVKDLTGIEMDL
jgi:hypothetical protein